MTAKTVPVRFVFRSQSMIPVLTVAQGARFWEREEIDVREFAPQDDPITAEEDLFAGRIDWIFGNHLSPYVRMVEGRPIACLASSENWATNWVATRPDITELRDLAGKRIVGQPLMRPDGEFSGHATGNRILMLELHGVDTRRLEYVEPRDAKADAAAVLAGQADAAFVAPERSEPAVAAGLRVHKPAPMPMVHSLTFTTTLERTSRDDDLAGRVIRVLLRAIHHLKTRKAETLELWKRPVAPFRPGQVERLSAHYEEMAEEFQGDLYPRAESILNAHRLASMVYPGAEKANPIALWDLHPLRDVHRSGFDPARG
jgi:hypothetical protein